jgi:cytoskeletal protein CcmA (bactofilin family)
MFGREKSSPAQSAAPVSKIETIIGPNAHFRGEIQSDGGMRIDGICEGTLDIAGNLVIGEAAKIIADIKANNISISGAVKGNINGNRVEILKTGRVWGDLMITSLLLEEGAYLRGQTTMHGDIEPPLIEAPKTAPTAAPPSPAIVDVEPRPQETS